MFRARVVLATLGLAAAVSIPAVAMARSGGWAQGGCDKQGPCCSRKSARCDMADPIVTCPMTGQPIKASQCPLSTRPR